ncbi:MAG TPA: hypothetical protein VL147_20585 [Devosia sp.]|jgi:hypothetical protein|nr:hypothetical protein [Devosia sp.]
MKYDTDLIFSSGLPDAPLSMPKQALERRRSVMVQLRHMLAVLPWL